MKSFISCLSLALFLPIFPGQRPLVWVAIGDSITYLNDHKDETGHRLTRGYMTQVTGQLPSVRYVNQGHNGWMATQIARSFDTLHVPAGADVYSVFLGTNDWWHGNPLGTFRDYTNNTGDSTVYGAFRRILDKLRQLNRNATIILLTPMPRADFVYINDARNNAYGSYRKKNGLSLEQIADAVLAIGRYEKTKVIDLYHEPSLALSHLVRFKRLKAPGTGVYTNYPYPSYIDIPFHPRSDEYPYPVAAMDMTYDGLHPSDKGDSVIADRLVKILKKL